MKSHGSGSMVSGRLMIAVLAASVSAFPAPKTLLRSFGRSMFAMPEKVEKKKCLILALIIVLNFCTLGSADAEKKCVGGTLPKSLQLRQQLFCGYDPLVRPVVQHTNTTQISIHLRVMFLFFNDDDNTLNIHSWTQYRWRDEHLVWDKSKFDNIKTLYISTSSIWVPDIELYSSADLGAASTGISGRQCWLLSTGNISCVIPTMYSAHCVADISRWPYDKHNCSVRVGSWSQDGPQVNVSLFRDGLSSNVEDGFQQNRDWELLETGASYQSLVYRNTTHPWIQFHFVLQRNSAGHTATVVIPALVLAMMSLMAFLLHPDSPDRVGLICVTGVCNCLYLLYLDAYLPGNGQSYPVILLFYRNTFLLVGASLLFTIFERSLGKAVSYPPTWVSIIFSLALDSRVGQKIFILRAAEAKVEGSAFSDRAEEGAVIPGWRSIVFLLDHLIFMVYASAFFVFIIAYVV